MVRAGRAALERDERKAGRPRPLPSSPRLGRGATSERQRIDVSGRICVACARLTAEKKTFRASFC